ncbi:MAG: dynamin-like GTPase mgm1 [Alyxoria varia]|nr:MAG: dynamin-like GTPase mgm1 [Alyxoria varia]
MSGRLLAAGVALGRHSQQHATRRLFHQVNARAGMGAGTLRVQRPLPFGAASLHNNVPAVRSISFARTVPKLFLKLARLPAMAGGAAVAGLAYIQYQANQAGSYAKDLFNRGYDSASTVAGGMFSGVNTATEQISRGWGKTKEDLEASSWYQRVMNGEEASRRGNGGSNGKGPNTKESSFGSGSATAGAATAGAFGLAADSEDDNRSNRHAARDDQMMMLTKKMIEIRSLLQMVGQGTALTLPSIVVVGSQSSGKSSVLEAIVGHEFLPKGSNMVTRRPIELTLVNTPDAKAEYAEFPALGLGKVTDFTQVQRTLKDLNMAVPEEECVSDDPIQLRICSPKVPDLSLIDLPGYIQVSGYDQPSQLKTKISELCDKYIKAPNIILAISAADVDLANSTSLRASRRIDPRGERTIGVVTKMDLVDPQRGASILDDKKYPLRLGYVGVVCKIPQTSGLFNRGGGNITNAIVDAENSYFRSHPTEFGSESPVTVGTTNLRQKLMKVLEQTMSSSLIGTTEAIRQELAEASYEFKVQYNERPLSAESYLAESLDAFKHSFKSFSEGFGRVEIRDLLKHELDQQVLNLLAQRYWNKPLEDLSLDVPDAGILGDLSKANADDPIWQHKLEASRSSLTKLGIGRLTAGVVANSLQAHVDQLISNSSFAVHPFARKAITEASSNILKDLSYETSDELEICIKPYKYRIEVEESDWNKGRESMSRVLKEELKTVEDAFGRVENDVGGKKKLKDVIGFIDRVRKGEVVLEGDGAGGAGGFSSALLRRGREAVFLRDRADILKMRMKSVRSKQCANKSKQYQCPEIFLDAVADRLTTTADFFLDAELLAKFFYLFPRELDARLGRNLSQADMERFAREDPKTRRHLDVVKRKELLELVLKETESLQRLEGRERRTGNREVDSSSTATTTKSRGWGLF